ncbi:MAG: DUF4375 domain-containing protein [Cyclobacteriaceae bacterium]|nr:DUF4375 domain-containing protein [Cyclobacteriaceae bacterium]
MISKVKITTETTKNLTDEQLDDLVYTKAADLYLGTFGERFKENDNDKLLQDIFSLTVLDNEVKNGGFDQFFRSYDDLRKFALNGLRLINAYKHAELVEMAAAIHDMQKEEHSNKRNANLNPLDEDYYKLDDITILRQRFVRAHIDRFAE